MTQQEVSDVLDRNFDRLEAEFPDHTGIGVTKDNDEFVIRVAVPRISPERCANATKEVEGVRIVILDEDMTGTAF